jgi:sugar/nucleoside kinase (ribokinase family)
MTITVVGHLCIDEVHLPQDSGVTEQSFGGIFFSLVTLSALMAPTDTVHPVFGIGEAEHDDFLKMLEKYPNIDTSGIFKLKGNTNHVHLFYDNERNSRIECSKHISDPIPFNKIRPYLDTDGILINMISGSDITLETLDKIRMSVRDVRTPIHFDFHSLTLGIDQDYKRFRRPLADWRRWCFMLNSIQMSEDEASGLTAENFDEPTLVNHLMSLMVSAFVVTRGDRGATAILQENKKLSRYDFPGASFGPVVDPTGCGDVFGASFLHSFLKQKNYKLAAEFANQVAGMKATFKGTELMSSIVEKLNRGTPVN